MKKRILIVSPHIDGLGGISKVLAIWRDADFFAGYNVTYVPTTNDSIESKLLTALLAVCQFMLYLPSADMVYIHSSAYTSFYRKSLFLLFARLFGKKVILHIHPSGFYDFYSGTSGFSRSYSTFVLGQVATFVVLADEMKCNISKHFPGAQIHVLRNAVNLQEMADCLGIQRRTDELLYLGWYIRAKGVYELVDAIGILRDRGIPVHLNLYGTKEVAQLTEYVRSKQLTSEITVNGWIGSDGKLKALYESTMLILPSHSEGIPNVILEAMATRTPIVATFVGGMKEILCDGENSLTVAVDNPLDLSNKIQLMLQDSALRNRLAENSYREAAEKYDVPVIRRCFRKIIEEAGQ